jgi:hypothetical protein
MIRNIDSRHYLLLTKHIVSNKVTIKLIRTNKSTGKPEASQLILETCGLQTVGQQKYKLSQMVKQLQKGDTK